MIFFILGLGKDVNVFFGFIIVDFMGVGLIGVGKFVLGLVLVYIYDKFLGKFIWRVFCFFDFNWIEM